jgi:arylsulfatase A-like enzyme
VGTVLSAIARLGFAHNTIVMVTADHGELAGVHDGMLGKGPDIYKETVRVPLLVRHPDARSGSTDALVGGIDLVPTLLSFAGLSDPERRQRYPDLHGVNVSSVIADGKARTARDERGILFNYGTPSGPLNGNAPGSSVRTLIRGVFDGRFKFGRYFKLHEHHQPRDWDTLVAHNDLELYDTHDDPDEIVNLAFHPDTHQEKIVELNSKVNALIDSEIGIDDGSIYRGAPHAYELKTG